MEVIDGVTHVTAEEFNSLMRHLSILIVDVESTCWEKNQRPANMESEIIQVGAVVYDPNQRKVVKEHRIYVTPEVSTIGEFCTNLTGITPEIVEREGVPFSALYDILLPYGHMTWGSWGDYDRKMFEHDAHTLSKGKYPFGPAHINIKGLYKNKRGRGAKTYGMDEILSREGLPLIGIHHDGLDDARNIAAIYDKVFIGEGF